MERSVVELTGPPNLTLLYPKILLAAVRRRGGELPDTELRLGEVRMDPDHLAAFDRVCGFRLTGEAPATYPRVLAFPLAMRLMADPGFPFPLAGIVHIADRITQRRPITLDDRLGLRVWAEHVRPHDRGTQFDLVHEASTADGPVWTEWSTYLRRAKQDRPAGKDGAMAGPAAPPAAPTALWRVGKDVGRRFADVSGDRNPIHLSTLAAKAFGFPRAIAHGAWTLSRCLAALEGRLPAAYTVRAEFKRPILLRSTVAFRARTAGDGWHCTVDDPKRGIPHLTVEIAPS